MQSKREREWNKGMEMWRNWTIPIKYKLTFYMCIRKQTNDHQSSVELTLALRQAAAKVTGYHFKLYVLSVSLLFLIIAVISTNTSNPLNDTKICIIIVFELLTLQHCCWRGEERWICVSITSMTVHWFHIHHKSNIIQNRTFCGNGIR